MSSSEAQKSPVHAATEDSTAEPTGPTARPPGATPGAQQGSRADNSPGTGNDLPLDAADLKSRPDTATGVPGNFERGAAMAGRHPDTDADADANPPGATNVIGGGPGAGDASSGGGAGAGIPGGGTDMRTDGAIRPGNPDEDRKRLFPDAPAGAAGGTRSDETKIRNDPDESSFGGPLNLDDPDAV